MTRSAEPTCCAASPRCSSPAAIPRLGGDAWRLEDDPELALARRAAPAHVSFVSLGTRKVYAPSGRPLSETDRVGPIDRYGQHKLALEHALAGAAGPRA